MNRHFLVVIKHVCLFLALLMGIIISLCFWRQKEEIPSSRLLLYYQEPKKSVFARLAEEVEFRPSIIDSIYESKEYNDYTYTESDLLLAKEYRLYTTDKKHLFEKIFKKGHYQNSILIPADDQ